MHSKLPEVSMPPRGGRPTGFTSLPVASRTLPADGEVIRLSTKGPGPGRSRRRYLLGAVAIALGAVVAYAGNLSERVFPTEPVAGIPALKKSDDGELLHWDQLKEVTLHVDPSLKVLGDGVEEAIAHGFGAWIESGEDLPAIRFEHSKHPNAKPKRDHRNVISYGPIELPGHEGDLAITIAYSNPKTGEIVEADIILNSRHPFELLDANTMQSLDAGESCKSGGASSKGCSAGYDVQSVVAHEVGHFLGLGEDFSDAKATMFHCTSRCEVHKRGLEASDSALLGDLYQRVTAVRSNAAGCGQNATTEAVH